MNFVVTPKDLAALEGLMAAIPNPTGEVSQSKVLRACLRLGMQELLKDPSRNLDAIEPPQGRPSRSRG